jgi:hypothetical protein
VKNNCLKLSDGTWAWAGTLLKNNNPEDGTVVQMTDKDLIGVVIRNGSSFKIATIGIRRKASKAIGGKWVVRKVLP